MDFAKFSALCLGKEIFFCRADKFHDPFEVTIPNSNRKNIEKNINANSQLGFNDPLSKYMLHVDKNLRSFNKDARRWCYISCWHANDCESAAMWELYGNLTQGIALQTNFGLLKNCVDSQKDKIIWKKVRYINFSDAPDNLSDERKLCFYKRKSFSHESEIRGAIFELPPRSSGEGLSDLEKVVEGLGVDYAATNDKEGIYIKVDLSRMVENIYVSPNSPDWFLKMVKNFLLQIGCNFNVKKSDLYTLD